MGITVYSLLWVMQDFVHQPYYTVRIGDNLFDALTLILKDRFQLTHSSQTQKPNRQAAFLLAEVASRCEPAEPLTPEPKSLNLQRKRLESGAREQLDKNYPSLPEKPC